MTNEEKARNIISGSKTCVEMPHETAIAIEKAIDKAIPKPYTQYHNGELRCSVCGNEIEKHQNYCEDCGQCIDWISVPFIGDEL